jgi:hypothetical protein
MMILYTIILFVILTPSVVFQFPKKGNKYTVAFVHGLIFAVVFHFTHNMLTFNKKENYETWYSDSLCKNSVRNHKGTAQRYKYHALGVGKPLCVKAN